MASERLRVKDLVRMLGPTNCYQECSKEQHHHLVKVQEVLFVSEHKLAENVHLQMKQQVLMGNQ